MWKRRLQQGDHIVQAPVCKLRLLSHFGITCATWKRLTSIIQAKDKISFVLIKSRDMPFREYKWPAWKSESRHDMFKCHRNIRGSNSSPSQRDMDCPSCNHNVISLILLSLPCMYAISCSIASCFNVTRFHIINCMNVLFSDIHWQTANILWSHSCYFVHGSTWFIC